MDLLFRFQEKGNLEVLLFTIQSRMRANNQKVYTPKEGALVADINRVRNKRNKLQLWHRMTFMFLRKLRKLEQILKGNCLN